MSQPPVSEDITAALARFFHRGAGPSHTKLTNAFTATGYRDADPYNPVTQTPNKEDRVLRVMAAARRRPDRARELVDAILVPLRVEGHLQSSEGQELLGALQKAFRRSGWKLDDDGFLKVQGAIDLTTGGRAALDEQLERLRRATDDPGQLLGTAKDLLESVSKFVLEELGMPYPHSASFDHLWHLARDRLGVLPQQVDMSLPGGRQIRTILQSSWTIAEQVNELRGLQGAGHGRTLPTGVSPELALLVVREACSVAEYCLNTLDKTLGN